MLLLLVGFAVLAEEVIDGPAGWLRVLDEPVLAALLHLRSPWLNQAAIEFTALGSATLVICTALVSLVIFLLARFRRGVVQLLVPVVGVLTGAALTCATPTPLEQVDAAPLANDLSVLAVADLYLPPPRDLVAVVPPDTRPRPARDWVMYPAVVQLDTAADIYVVGDVHGDYDTVAALLWGAKVIAAVPAKPTDVKWTAGSAILVCTGDLIDKYTQNLAVLDFFQALQAAAAAAGGKVIVTFGNHEAEFLADPTPSNTKAAAFIAELQAAGITPEDVGAGKNAYGQFLRSLPFAARVRDWFFAHAGNTDGRTMAKLIQDLQDGVDALGFGAPVLLASSSLLEARLSGGATPWWELPGKDPALVLGGYATALGAAHIVMGHQPGSVNFSDGTSRLADTMYQKFGKLFLMDVGMSRGADASRGPLMKIHKDLGTGTTTATAISPSGRSTMLWQG